MLKKKFSAKINGTKNVPFFLSRAPIYYSLNFNLQFSFKLKQKVVFSLLDSVLFLLEFVFLFKKIRGLFDFKTP